jgi:hypothetical protein
METGREVAISYTISKDVAGHSRSNGAAGTKHNGALVVQDG